MLEKKVAIVTGAGSGIGRELACTFAKNGAKVICVGRRLNNLNDTVERIRNDNGFALALRADVTNQNQVENFIKITLEKFGRIDILFNNAGSFKCLGPLWEVDPKLWWKDVETNLLGTMLCCRFVLPHMMEKDSGVIFNMDGGGGTPGPNIGGSGYGSSKAAILRLTESLSHELKRVNSNVLVYAMNPGTVKTEMLNFLLSQKDKLLWSSHIPKMFGMDLEAAPDACAKGTMNLLKIASKELSGRAFHHDSDYSQIAKKRKEIEKNNLYVLKWCTLEESKED